MPRTERFRCLAARRRSGLSLSPDGTRLYVALNMTHEVGVIDTAARRIVARVPVGIYPYTTVVSADGSKVYVTNWGGKVPGPTDTTDGMFPVVVDPRTGIPITGTVSVLDTASNAVVKTIDVGLHPTGLSLSPDGSRLYVTNGNSDTVSVISTAADAVVRTLHVGGPEPWKEMLLGASPNAVTVSPNGRTLYVANAAQNAIAVVDAFGDPRDPVRGLIPTGWYPRAVALDATGEQLFVGSGYGFGSIAPVPPGQGRSYEDRVGVVSILDVPSAKELRRLTKQVRDNNESLPPVVDTSFNERQDDDDRDGHHDRDRDGRHDGHDDRGHSRDPIPLHLGDRSPIKHVFYISRKTAPTIRCSVTCRRATAIRLWCSSDATSPRIITPWPNSSRCSTTTTVPAISRRSATAGCCRRIRARGSTSTATGAITRARCCSVRPRQSTTASRRLV
jgi:YVTN family beta-propeller protein